MKRDWIKCARSSCGVRARSLAAKPCTCSSSRVFLLWYFSGLSRAEHLSDYLRGTWTCGYRRGLGRAIRPRLARKASYPYEASERETPYPRIMPAAASRFAIRINGVTVTLSYTEETPTVRSCAQKLHEIFPCRSSDVLFDISIGLREEKRRRRSDEYKQKSTTAVSAQILWEI